MLIIWIAIQIYQHVEKGLIPTYPLNRQGGFKILSPLQTEPPCGGKSVTLQVNLALRSWHYALTLSQFWFPPLLPPRHYKKADGNYNTHTKLQNTLPTQHKTLIFFSIPYTLNFLVVILHCWIMSEHGNKQGYFACDTEQCFILEYYPGRSVVKWMFWCIWYGMGSNPSCILALIDVTVNIIVNL